MEVIAESSTCAKLTHPVQLSCNTKYLVRITLGQLRTVCRAIGLRACEDLHSLMRVLADYAGHQGCLQLQHIISDTLLYINNLVYLE